MKIKEIIFALSMITVLLSSNLDLSAYDFHKAREDGKTFEQIKTEARSFL
jgi:hypothetical protein